MKVYVGAAHTEHPNWSFQPTAVALRYPDLPETVTLSCPTLETFTIMKWSAYVDRHAPRDLFDLAGLTRLQAFDKNSEAILEQTTGFGFLQAELSRIPRSLSTAWESELSHQVADLPSPEECRRRVLGALENYSNPTGSYRPSGPRSPPRSGSGPNGKRLGLNGTVPIASWTPDSSGTLAFM